MTPPPPGLSGFTVPWVIVIAVIAGFFLWALYVSRRDR